MRVRFGGRPSRGGQRGFRLRFRRWFAALTERSDGQPCAHESASGVDRAEGPGKVWRCDGCSWLHRTVTEGGISRDVPVRLPLLFEPWFMRALLLVTAGVSVAAWFVLWPGLRALLRAAGWWA